MHTVSQGHEVQIRAPPDPAPMQSPAQSSARGRREPQSEFDSKPGSDCKFSGRRRRHFHPLRYQQLHVSWIRIRSRCHRRLHPLHGRTQNRLLFVQPESFARATLTSDHFRIVSGVRSTVAGDDAALYNSLLLTVKDAAPLRGGRRSWCFERPRQCVLGSAGGRGGTGAVDRNHHLHRQHPAGAGRSCFRCCI